MYAITGITGKVGGVVARALLSAGHRVRAVVRDADKGRFWSDLDCEVAIAEMEDAEALTRAFTSVTGVFILPPPNFDPEPGFPEAKAVISAVRQALDATRPARVVCLSTIGAQAAQSNLLTQRTLMEEAPVDAAVASDLPPPCLVHGKLELGRCPRPGTKASSPPSCSPSTRPCRWSPPRTSAGSQPNCCCKTGVASASSSSRARSG